MISVRFQGKPFNITVIQAYAPIINTEEVEFEWFYEDFQDLLELTPPKKPDLLSGLPLPFLLFDHFQFALIRGPNIPGSCAILNVWDLIPFLSENFK